MKRNYVLVFASAIVFMLSACSEIDRGNGVQEEIDITKVQYANDFRGRLLCEFTETTYEYDSYGNEIHSKSYSCETWSEYDEKGNEIHYKDSFGFENWSEYDANGNKIHFKSAFGNEYWTFYEFNEMGKITRKIEWCIMN